MLVSSAPEISGILISCGGPGDYGADGGKIVDRGNIPISGTDTPTLYQTERWGMSSYNIPVTPGIYDIVLHFCETYPGVTAGGQRVFTISANGSPPQPVDIFKAAGGRNRVLRRIIPDVDARSGEIVISFGKQINQPCVNAILIARRGVLVPAQAKPKPDPEPKPEPKPDPDPQGIEPPPAARAAGLTRLLFHADLNDPAQLSRTTKLTPGAKFCLMGRGNPIWGASELPSSAIRHEDGTISIVPNDNNYQGDIITSDSEENGFFLRGNRWYVEARIKHADVGSSKGTGFFAFWSMDAKHWYTNGPRGRSFLEPDFYEYIGRRFIHALHHHKAGNMNDQKMHMISTPPPVNVEEFFVAGAMAMPDEYSWYVDGQKRGEKSPPWYGEMADYKGPIIIGSGPQMPYTIDWVRVWGPAN